MCAQKLSVIPKKVPYNDSNISKNCHQLTLTLGAKVSIARPLCGAGIQEK